MFYHLKFSSSKTEGQEGIVSVRLNGVEKCNIGRDNFPEKTSSILQFTRSLAAQPDTVSTASSTILTTAKPSSKVAVDTSQTIPTIRNATSTEMPTTVSSLGTLTMMTKLPPLIFATEESVLNIPEVEEESPETAQKQEFVG